MIPTALENKETNKNMSNTRRVQWLYLLVFLFSRDKMLKTCVLSYLPLTQLQILAVLHS